MKHSHEADESTCPVERTAHLLGDSWTILIVRDLMNGSKRFGQLQDSLGSVSPKTLSHRLKMLEQAAIITRRAYPEIPPRVEYALTEKGRALCQVIDAMRTFGETYLMSA
jgi:DNA-binding HxlR family transcriptional regulator